MGRDFPKRPNPNHAIWYNERWELLMPVVEKIENMKEDFTFLYSIDIGRDWAAVEHNDFDSQTIVTHSVANNKILSLWHTIVKFIQWYNNQKL